MKSSSNQRSTDVPRTRRRESLGSYNSVSSFRDGSSSINKEQFIERASELVRGGVAFMRLWKEHEASFMSESRVEVNEWEDGEDYSWKIGDFTGIHKFKKSNFLGLKIPKKFGFDSLPKYLEMRTPLNVINSYTRETRRMTVETMLEKFKVPFKDRKWSLNLLSLEFGRLMPRLNSVFHLPGYVLEKSMVIRLKDLLMKKLEEIDVEGDDVEAEKINKMMRSMPSYTKFLLLSMENSFSDVHVDFSGTSVYYHVHTGKKIFYVAPPTPQNLAIFEDYEKNPGKRDWIGKLLFDQWTRLEVNPGETILIPSGYLHFVYTPKDSVVVGGNFLMDSFLQIQFDITKIEEYCLRFYKDQYGRINEGYVYQGFRNVMWANLEYFLIPKLIEDEQDVKLIEMGKIYLKEMDSKKSITKDWYGEEDKEKLLETLRGILLKSSPTSTANQPGSSSEPAIKKTRK